MPFTDATDCALCIVHCALRIAQPCFHGLITYLSVVEPEFLAGARATNKLTFFLNKFFSTIYNIYN